MVHPVRPGHGRGLLRCTAEPLYREFAQLAEFERLPDESTSLRFRHRLQEHHLARQILATVNDQAEKLKAGVRAKVEHPFRVIKRQFGYTRVRYRGLKKNTAQLATLFALSNLWMVRGKLMAARPCVRLKTAPGP
jgi:IS5 family transposase